MSLLEILEKEIFPYVEKASRYLGIEYNAIKKSLDKIDLRVTLIFPDLYDMGLGNLGLLILYHILNKLPWCWCERAYAPAPDMEQLLRARRLPLFAWESKEPLHKMDLIGFTLQSELTYTTVLNCIDLAGIPLHTLDRTDNHPIICAGGPGAFNPEPLADYIDFFVIGEAEEALMEIVECLRNLKTRPRIERLEALSKIEGVYVPLLYPTITLENGTILPDPKAPKITKRFIKNLDTSPFPENYIVPFTQQIHDRIAVEIMRGCTHGCRFCQAGIISRPVREKELATIQTTLENVLRSTGYEEVSLMSLSTCDYSRAKTLVFQSATTSSKYMASLSLPSIRLDSFSIELADLTTDVRRTSITVAPEAATPRLRAIINKWIPDEEFLELCAEAFRRGWQHIKAYFMIGLPQETDEDVLAIATLATRAIEIGRRITPSARIHLGVSTFVPKPFTPFQWAEQIPLEEILRRQDLLRNTLKKVQGVKFGYHSAKSSLIEGILSRGNRNTGKLLQKAWQMGARLDSWDEYLNFTAWNNAITELQFNVQNALRERKLDELLPWDHIDCFISKAWLAAEWQRSREGKTCADCRDSGCNYCGVSRPDQPRCVETLQKILENKCEDTAQPFPQLPKITPPIPVQRIRLHIGRRGLARFLSHLELNNAWIRTLRRAGIPLAYSHGFHAHPRISFATASPVGEISEGDYLDIWLTTPLDPCDILEKLKNHLPEDFLLFDVCEVPLKAPSLPSQVTGFLYDIQLTENIEKLQQQVLSLLKQNSIHITRENKSDKKTKTIDVAPMIESVIIKKQNDNRVLIRIKTKLINSQSLRIKEFCSLLGIDYTKTLIIKRKTFLKN